MPPATVAGWMVSRSETSLFPGFGLLGALTDSKGDPGKVSGKDASDPDFDNILLACPNGEAADAPVSSQKLRTPSISPSIGIFHALTPVPTDWEKGEP